MLFTLTMLSAYVAVVRATHARAARSDDGGDVVLGGFFFVDLELLNSAAVASPILLRSKTARPARPQFSIDVLAIGCHCRSGAAVAGEDGAAICACAAKLARRHAGRRSRATRGPTSNRSAFADVTGSLRAAAPAIVESQRPDAFVGGIVSDVFVYGSCWLVTLATSDRNVAR